MGRETGVPIAGVGLRRSAGETTGALLRPLGAFERMYQRRQQNSIMQFWPPACAGSATTPTTPASIASEYDGNEYAASPVECCILHQMNQSAPPSWWR